MAHPSTLYRFRLAVTDVDRGYYDSLDIRVALHPSETEPFLITRVIAYALNFEEGLRFSAGLSVPEEPAIWNPGLGGKIPLWIDIGSPAPKRVHKASKASDRVRIYTYKDPQSLIRELSGQRIHHADQIEIFALAPDFLNGIAARLARDNTWGVMMNDQELNVNIGEDTFTATLAAYRFL